MASFMKQFRFVDGVRGRAATIPPELWEWHKDELCDLYLTQQLALPRVMSAMLAKHGFGAS